MKTLSKLFTQLANIVYALTMALVIMGIGIASAGQIEDSAGVVEGIVRPIHFVKINSQITGKIKSIIVKEGERVKYGDSLIKLDDTLQKAAVDKATVEAASDAREKSAVYKLSESRVVLEQMKNAFQKNASAEWEVRRAEMQVNLAEMEVKAESEEKKKNVILLAAEKERLQMHLIKAPFDGIVRKLMVETGQTVSQSDPLIEIVDLSSLKAEFYLPAPLFGKLKKGDVCDLTAGDPIKKQIKGVVETADNTIDSASQTFRVVFSIDNSNQSFPSGFPVFFSSCDPKRDSK